MIIIQLWQGQELLHKGRRLALMSTRNTVGRLAKWTVYMKGRDGFKQFDDTTKAFDYVLDAAMWGG